MMIHNDNVSIIAVDFDGTLCYSNWPELGEPNLPLIHQLRYLRELGTKLILWTCRSDRQLEDAVEWCKGYDLYFDAINDNLPEVIELYGNNSRKISCDFYIDDRAIGLPFCLPESVLDADPLDEASAPSRFRNLPGKCEAVIPDSLTS